MSTRKLINTNKLETWMEDVQREANRIFGTDEEGAPNVELSAVDRTRYERMHYRALRYSHQALTPAERRWRTRMVGANLNIAATAARCEFDELERRSLRKSPRKP